MEILSNVSKCLIHDFHSITTSSESFSFQSIPDLVTLWRISLLFKSHGPRIPKRSNWPAIALCICRLLKTSVNLRSGQTLSLSSSHIRLSVLESGIGCETRSMSLRFEPRSLCETSDKIDLAVCSSCLIPIYAA